jgi:hypothetical protein
VADIVNLNRVRKERKRAAEERQAAINRAAFGRTKAEKNKDIAERAQRTRLLDGAHRDDPEA